MDPAGLFLLGKNLKRRNGYASSNKKTCSKCGKTKPLTAFYHDTTKTDKHASICMDCQLEVNKNNKKTKK